MDCQIEFTDGSTVTVLAVDGSWNWFDLFETLLDLDEISQGQYDEAELSLDFDDSVQSNISFLSVANAAPTPVVQARGIVDSSVNQPRKKLGGTSSPTINKSTVQVGKKASVSGLKRKSNPIPKAYPIPAPKSTGSGGLKRKTSSPKQEIVSNLTFSMSLKCSRDGSDWAATLVSQHKPIKSDANLTQPSSKGKFGGSIHLVLDDSSSMDGEANRQLKSAAIAFLAERPRGENIVLHTFNESLSGSGSPSEVSSLVSRLTCPGLTPMCACLYRVNSVVSGGDVIIFFSDGGSTDGDPTSIATKIKSREVRFITIGCGSGVNKSLMRALASSKADYHHAKSASGILQAFQAVAKSLSQRQIAHSSSGNKSGSTIVARQVQSHGYAASSVTSSGYGSDSSVLADNEGFEFIEEFKCHHCSSSQRIACAYCGKNMCSGGARGNKASTESTILCPYCNEVSEVEVTQKGVHAGVGKLGGKKGK